MVPERRPSLPSRDVRRVIRAGRRVSAGRVVLYVLPSDGPARAAFVSARSVGGAVVRNRARRLLREAWRAMAPAVSSGCDAVLRARPEIRAATAAEVRDDVARAMATAGMVERG